MISFQMLLFCIQNADIHVITLQKRVLPPPEVQWYQRDILHCESPSTFSFAEETLQETVTAVWRVRTRNEGPYQRESKLVRLAPAYLHKRWWLWLLKYMIKDNGDIYEGGNKLRNTAWSSKFLPPHYCKPFPKGISRGEAGVAVAIKYPLLSVIPKMCFFSFLSPITRGRAYAAL
jgi:hypothetical protein